MLCSRIPGLALRRVRLDTEGSVAGVGLFTARDVKAGELLTLYPGDVLAHLPSDAVVWGPHVNERLRCTDDDSFNALIDYGVSVDDDNYSVIGHPELNHDSSYLGHFTNDACRWLPPEFDSLPEADGDFSDEEAYEAASQSRANAMHTDLAEGLHMATVATRDIQKGEEVFVSYGADYWFEHADREELIGPSLAISPTYRIGD